MLYNDEETKAFEEKFKTMLAKTREFMSSQKAVLEENLKTIIENSKSIIEKPDKTEEEIAFLQNLRQQLQPVVKALSDMQLILDESLFRQASLQYQHIKKLAEEGNEKAMKAYLDLKPHYETMLREQMNDN